MFDISTQLVSEQDEISGLEKIGWENLSWKYLSLIGDERVINLQRTKVYVFSDSVLCLGKIFENTQSNDAWEQRLGCLKTSQNYRNFDRIDGEPMDFEWNIFPGFNNEEVKSLLLRLGETPENFTGRIIFMSMFNDISCESRDNEKECLLHAKLLSLHAKRLGKGQCSFLGPGSEKKWYCISEDSPQGEWDNMAERMLLEFAESGCPIFRAPRPLSRGRLKSKGHGKLSIHYAADLETIETIFRIVASASQVSLYGAIAEMCEEYETLHERSGQPVVVGRSSSSLVLSVIKTEVPLDCDDLANKDVLLQQYGERIEELSQQDKIEQILYGCWIFGMLLRLDSTSRRKTLQNVHNFMQWPVVNTLFQEKKKHHNQKDGSKGTPKLGPCWKLPLVVCMVSTELRSELCR